MDNKDTVAENFQRVGAVSNSHVGREFEAIAERILRDAGIAVSPNFPVDVGVAMAKKPHKFDLGADSPPVLVECKSHRWTSGGNVPSAKITVWNEAMYYFSCAPSSYRKIFFVLRDERAKTGETLVSYYLRTYGHLIPGDIEIWEYDASKDEAEIVNNSDFGESDEM